MAELAIAVVLATPLGKEVATLARAGLMIG